MKKHLLATFVILIVCCSCAVLPEPYTAKIAKQEAERQAIFQEENRKNELKRQENEAAVAKVSESQSQYGIENGEPAIFRKCVNEKVCNDYHLMIPKNYSIGQSNQKLIYGYTAIPYDDVKDSNIKVAKNVNGIGDFIVLDDMRKVQIKCSTRYSNGSTTNQAERCQHVTLREVEELKRMIGKTVWVSTPVMVSDFMLSPAHTLQVIDISTDIINSYSDDYNYIVKVDNKETLYIPVRLETVSKKPVKSDWGSAVISAIKNGEVFIGMTGEQALLAWGKPSQINKTITNNLEYEQWVYNKDYLRADYLYFYNNKLHTIQKF